VRRIVATTLGLLAVAAMAFADEPSLQGRLDPQTAAAVREVLEQARAAGLPVAPLIAKALEGATKKAAGPRIVQAVRRHADALGQARDLLGAQSSEGEIVAGAGALLGGIPGDSLARLRAARPSESVVVPLVVLADLVARRVPPGTASNAVLAAARAGIRDADLMTLRARVEHDIRAGAAPATAASVRSRALLMGQERVSPTGGERERAPLSRPPPKGTP
jgi:hypothetical protein